MNWRVVLATSIFCGLCCEPVMADAWTDAVANGMKWSADEHGGTPDLRRACYPQTQTCETAVVYHNKIDGSIIILKMTSDLSDKPLFKQTCIFNATEDIETCIGYDNGPSARFMKDQRGNWTRVQ